jgi:hypothetical protein
MLFICNHWNIIVAVKPCSFKFVEGVPFILAVWLPNIVIKTRLKNTPVASLMGY